MALFRRLAGAFVFLALVAILTSCGSKPVTFAELPLPSEAQPLEEGTNTVADQMAAAMRQSLSTQEAQAEIKLYTLPAAMGWDEVLGFYNDKLKESDWKSEESLKQDNEFMKVVGWGRGSFASEQGLVIGYIAPILDSEPLLLVALASE